MASGVMRGPIPHSANSRDMLVWIVSAFIILDFVYAITFNLLPDNFRLVFVGLLFLGQSALGLISLAMRLDTFRLSLALVSFLMISVWLASTAMFGSDFHPEAALRRIAPVMAAVFFIGFADRLPVRLITYCAYFTIVFAVVWAAVQPAYFHSTSELARFAPFHGGAAEGGDNAHASGYIILACILIIHQAMLAGYTRPNYLAWLFIGCGAALIGGYWSTQVQLSLVAYFGVHLMMVKRVSLFAKLFVAMVFVVAVGALLIEKESRNIAGRGVATYETAAAGTGRIATWLDRIDKIEQRPAARNILGDGLLTDRYTSPTWDKLTHSHNLALTYMMESGVAGTVVFLSIIFLPVFYFGRAYVAILTLVLAGSMVDIGITHRGMAYMFFWIAVGILALRLRSPLPENDRAAVPTRRMPFSPVAARRISA